MYARPGGAEAWHWLADAEAMLLAALWWAGAIAVVVVGALALVAVLAGGRD